MSPRWQPLPSAWSAKRNVRVSTAEAPEARTRLPLSLALNATVASSITMTADTAGLSRSGISRGVAIYVYRKASGIRPAGVAVTDVAGDALS